MDELEREEDIPWRIDEVLSRFEGLPNTPETQTAMAAYQAAHRQRMDGIMFYPSSPNVGVEVARRGEWGWARQLERDYDGDTPNFSFTNSMVGIHGVDPSRVTPNLYITPNLHITGTAAGRTSTSAPLSTEQIFNAVNNARKEMAETETTVDPTVQPVSPIPIEGKCNVDFTNLPAPKHLKTELEYLVGYFIVQSEDGTFGYYPIKYQPGKKGNFYRIRNSPPFLVNGIVCLEDTFISVPISDLVRKHVNTTRIISRREVKGSSTKKSEAAIGLERDTNQSGLVELDESEVNKAIDLVMQEQADALLHLEDSKEEW